MPFSFFKRKKILPWTGLSYPEIEKSDTRWLLIILGVPALLWTIGLIMKGYKL